MSTIESTELRLADEKIKALESEIDDYREFVKSAKIYFDNTQILSNRHNAQIMCKYLYRRYFEE